MKSLWRKEPKKNFNGTAVNKLRKLFGNELVYIDVF